MKLTLQSIVASSVCQLGSDPTVNIYLPGGYTLTGGGAWIGWGGMGNLLVGSYPLQPLGSSQYTGWRAEGSDQGLTSPASAVVFAIGIRIVDINNNPLTINQTVVSQESAKVEHPYVEALLPDGFYLTGGGARGTPRGQGRAGQLLTGSYPLLINEHAVGWVAASKDQVTPCPGRVTSYAIGIQVPNATIFPHWHYATGQAGEFPTATVEITTGHTLVGGGANDSYTGAGNLLTASYPVLSTPGGSGWTASGKDQQIADPSGTIKVYALSISI